MNSKSKPAILIVLLVMIFSQQAKSQKLVNKVAHEVCDCMTEQIESEGERDLETILFNCVEPLMFKYEKKLRKEYGDNFFDDPDSKLAQAFGLEIAQVLAVDCPLFLELAVEQESSDRELAVGYYDRAEQEEAAGNYPVAIEYYTKAIEEDPDEFNYYNSRGVCYYSMGNYYRALSDFYRAMEVEPENYLAYYNCGYALYEMEDYEMAGKEADKAIELYPDYCSAYNLKGLISDSENDSEKAVHYFSMAWECDSSKSNYAYNIGYSLYRNRKQEEAMPWFMKAYEKDPQNNILVSYIGNCYDDMGESDKAVKFHTRTIVLTDSANYIPFYNRGLAWFHLEEYEKALIDFNKAYELDSSDLDIIYYRAETLNGWEKYEEALEQARLLLEQNPGNAEYYDLRADLYTKTGEYKLALLDYTVSLSLYPDDCNIHYLMGKLYDELGQTEDAEASYLKSEEMGCKEGEVGSPESED